MKQIPIGILQELRINTLMELSNVFLVKHCSIISRGYTHIVITERRKFGNTGEDIAAKFLVKHGYSVLERNFLRKVGEIDIICRKNNKTHFVEVKTISWETRLAGISRETDKYRPEDNLSPAKLRRIKKTIEIYLAEYDVEDFEFHAILVVLDPTRKTARVKMLRNLII